MNKKRINYYVVKLERIRMRLKTDLKNKTEQQNRCMRSHEYLGGYYRKQINDSNTWHV